MAQVQEEPWADVRSSRKALTPKSTATESYPWDEHSGEEEKLPYKCDGCLGPVYVLPLSRLCEDHGSSVHRLTGTERCLVVSVSLCHPQGTLNIPGDWEGTERTIVVLV